MIINAISVRINMPRGTVKALMACFLALIVIALVYANSVTHSRDDSYLVRTYITQPDISDGVIKP